MTKSSFMMNKIVLYDYLRVNGGAERFVCNYIKNNHDYKLLVSTIYKDYKLPEYLHRNKIITLFNHSYAINLRIMELLSNLKLDYLLECDRYLP